jgi:hypothetical protein
LLLDVVVDNGEFVTVTWRINLIIVLLFVAAILAFIRFIALGVKFVKVGGRGQTEVGPLELIRRDISELVQIERVAFFTWSVRLNTLIVDSKNL